MFVLTNAVAVHWAQLLLDSHLWVSGMGEGRIGAGTTSVSGSVSIATMSICLI